MTIAGDVQQWVQEPESLRLPVSVIARRVVRMNMELRTVGDVEWMRPDVHPIGLDYAVLLLAPECHVEMLPEGETLIAAAYQACRERLRPYVTVTPTVTASVAWDNLFPTAGGAIGWFTELLGNALPADPDRDKVRWGDATVHTHSGDVDVWVAREERDDRSVWPVVLPAPTREQRQRLTKDGWQVDGATVTCDFPTVALAAAALVTVLDWWGDLPATPLSVTLYGPTADATLPPTMDGQVQVEALPGEIWPPWRGSDAATIPGTSADSRCFSWRGVLLDPVAVIVDDEQAITLRAAGFPVAEDEITVGTVHAGSGDTYPVVVYPKSTPTREV